MTKVLLECYLTSQRRLADVILWFCLSLTYKISAIWLVEKSTKLAALYSRFQCCNLWQKQRREFRSDKKGIIIIIINYKEINDQLVLVITCLGEQFER